MTPVRRTVVLTVAILSSIVAFLLVRSQFRSTSATDQPDYFCYTLRKAWVCAYTRPECEMRLARERPADILTRCQSHYEEVLTP